MTEVTKTLARFAAGLRHEAIPPAVRERAKLLVLDTIGIAVRARHDTDSTPPTLEAARTLGLDHGQARVFGERGGWSPAGAALVNGALAHSLDFDDTHAPASLHPSAPVVPAALAAAEIAGRSSQDALVGIIAGYEVICRISRALIPSEHYDLGFHPTATCGVFAAAAAAGRVLGLSPEQMEDAYGIALSEAAGSLQFLGNGAWTKRFQVGHSAMAGLMAAVFASKGYRGAAPAFEGRYGFFHAYARNARPELAIEGLGQAWETTAIAVKPYPACRAMHAAVDGVIQLRARHNLVEERIKSIRVGLSETALRLVGTPQEQKRQPANVVDGQFSCHFGVGVAMREGRFGWDDYAGHIGDARTNALLARVEVGHDARAEAEYPRQFAAAVAIETVDGVNDSLFVPIPKGEPENFQTADELRAKYAALVQPVIGAAQEARLFQAVMGMDSAASGGGVAAIFDAAAPNSPDPARKSA
ncbi:2-methylcitrate dehydratase PrpD [Stella humosa]|uniref:2-methylcitrate dehydratase PrpD n=1 Tax=Stella humosa TaxID=94 RepID=A0A3N1L122_9PROT|nr:MmgE/PrpD family protein [Stella humosa]ROP84298.1 2-methylcitrate dehydratase PrpD [Stella humosa]BBK33811.1 2-methylcitrate dehydratase [Stella humosa]